MEEKLERINNILVRKFGIPDRPKKLPNPVDTLIATILSQNTNDKNSFQAYKNLKGKFRNWEEVASQPVSRIEFVIKSAGLAKQKSKAIKNLLVNLLDQRKKIKLDYFNDLTNEEIIKELTSFKGIGVKTASCVLLFSLNRNVCPVDTHVHRTLNRIGLVKTGIPEKTFYQINASLPDKTAHQFHTNLIRLGREICKPIKPLCSICPLLNYCNYKSKNLLPNVQKKQKSFMLLDKI